MIVLGRRRPLIRPRILLADDHHEFLEAEIALLRPHFELVGTASNGVSLISEAERLKPDVVVVLGACSLILRAASSPFRMGIATSATITSGLSLRAISIKARPSETTPTTG
jgi:DNA-binding NarL/FixJ family response regulator